MSKKTSSPSPAPGGQGGRSDVPLPDIKKRGIRGFLRDVRRELKLVIWPSRQETIRLSFVVLAVCFGVVVILYGLGFIFGFIIDLLIGRS